MKAFMMALLIAFGMTALAQAGGISSVGGGNPAAKFCAEQGGALVSVIESGGEGDWCALGGHAFISEWTFFYSRHGHRSQRAVDALLGRHGQHRGDASADVLAATCEELGGQTEGAKKSDGESFGICRFPDYSAIEEGTLYHGADSPSNSALVRTLTDQSR